MFFFPVFTFHHIKKKFENCSLSYSLHFSTFDFFKKFSIKPAFKMRPVWTHEQIQALIDARRTTNPVNTFIYLKIKFNSNYSNSVNIYCNLFRRIITPLGHSEGCTGVLSLIWSTMCATLILLKISVKTNLIV